MIILDKLLTLWGSVLIEELLVAQLLINFGLDDPGFVSWQGQKIFLSPETSRPALGPTQPPIQWVPKFYPGVKRPGCDVDHWLPSSAEVNNKWSYTSPYPVCLHGMDRDTFTFYSRIYLYYVESHCPLTCTHNLVRFFFWISPIESTVLNSIWFKIYFDNRLYSSHLHLGLARCILSSGFLTRYWLQFSSVSFALHVRPILDSVIRMCYEVFKLWSFLITQFSPASSVFYLFACLFNNAVKSELHGRSLGLKSSQGFCLFCFFVVFLNNFFQILG
jgi:hypothetical protein